ncbi:MAG: metallophosphoesterase [Candidatus Aenigmarchaeota archaeon]|nr:metallophosphoesterase [Candidatus Aenigmarchaeota archaeon]
MKKNSQKRTLKKEEEEDEMEKFLGKDKIIGRPIKLNQVELLPRKGKDYTEVVYLGDVHFGSPQCDEERLFRMIDYCVEKNIYVFLMGDLIDLATRYSIGAGVYEQRMNPAKQVEKIVEILSPLAKKHLIIGFLNGNHEERAYKESGINVGAFMARELNTRFLGYACWNLFRVGKENYTVYTWHGVSSARFEWTKIKAAVDTANSFDCDLFAMGHVHTLANTAQLRQYVDLRSKTVKESKKIILITGHYLKYDRGKKGIAS